MAYKITRNVVHNINHSTHRFVDWIIYDVSFINDIQPIYPSVTEQEYYSILNDFSLLIEPLSGWEGFFTNTPGFVSYSYNYNGIPENTGVTNYTQEFLFTDQESYIVWQLQENEKGDTRLSKWRASLEEKSIDYNNVIIEGTQMVNSIIGDTIDMSIVKYLSTKYFILRKTQLSIVHSII
jgi:hypothetical protein